MASTFFLVSVLHTSLGSMAIIREHGFSKLQSFRNGLPFVLAICPLMFSVRNEDAQELHLPVFNNEVLDPHRCERVST